MRNGKWIVFLGLLIVAATFRIAVAHWLPNDSADDGRIYAQLARNVLEQRTYSGETEPPYTPTLIRLPGYPLFLAAIYKVFGHGNNGAVRVVQALIDTATCALIALLAFCWEPDAARKRATAIAALALAALCPFTAIYATTILTEVPTMFFAVAMCVAATLALRRTFTTEDPEENKQRVRKMLLWWLVAGLLGGLAVLFRPDGGLFVAAVGLTLVIAGAIRLKRHLPRMVLSATILSLGFVLVLAPWTIRNARVFHLFQPLAPSRSEMPGEFVPRGYFLWLRTWLDHQRYIDPFLWSLDEKPITLDDVPPEAFDSAQEKDRVAALLEKYNHPIGSPALKSAPQPSPTPQASPMPTPANSRQSAGKAAPSPTPKNSNANANAATDDETDQNDNSSDQDDETDNKDEATQSEPEPHSPVEMTPEIDAAFAQIARERIARHPFSFYVWLPVARAETMWVDTHSQYWPFEGDLLPFEDLDYAGYQHIWLSLFAALTGLYSLLGALGGWVLWSSRKRAARGALLLVALIITLRLALFANIESPEPRYLVEFFPILSVLGGIAITHVGYALKKPGRTEKHG